MRPHISLITTAAFLLHFGLGCCAHHAHSATDAGCAGQVSSVSHSSHHDCESADTPSPCHSDAPRDDCEEGQCVFLAGVKTSPVKEVSFTWIPAAILDLSHTDFAAARAYSPHQPGESPPLHVRLHLFHQIFLI